VTEPKRRLDIEPKTGIPSMAQWAAYKRQSQLYARGIMQGYERCLPVPMGPEPCGDGELIEVDYARLEKRYLAGYAAKDIDFTGAWWSKFHTPVLVNRLTRREYRSYTELVRPETLAAMARPLARATAYPDYGWKP